MQVSRMHHKLWLLLFVLVLFASPLQAEVIVGGARVLNCVGGWCTGSSELPVVIRNSGNGVSGQILAVPDATYEAYYAGHAFFEDGRSVLLALEDDCLGDGSFEQCLAVAVFDSEGALIAMKTFLSTYRQTDPQYVLIQKSLFRVVGVSTWNDKIVIALDYPREPLVLILDSSLNIVDQIVLPESPRTVAGPWVVLYSNALVDLTTGKVYSPPYSGSLYINKAVAFSGGLALFYSSPEGWYGEFYTYLKWVQRDEEGLRTVKKVTLSFSDADTPGFPGFISVSRTSRGWMMPMTLWHDFGGNISYGIIMADSGWNTFSFYRVAGSERGDWQGYDLIENSGALSTAEGDLYIPLGADSGVAVVRLSALPLKESDAMSVSVQTDMDEVWEPMENATLGHASYIVECSQCLPFALRDLSFPVGTIKEPVFFYVSQEVESDGANRWNVFGRFFCYGPPNSKVYCGFIVDGSVWLFDRGTGGFVPFDASQMDVYTPFTNITEPQQLFSLKLCEETTALLPEIEVYLFAVAIPAEMNLSSAIQSGDFQFSMVPWKIPNCR